MTGGAGGSSWSEAGRRLALGLRKAWVLPLALGILPFCLFWRLTLLKESFFVHDVQHYFYPYHLVTARLLHEGHLPLWNPYAFSGIPLLGDGQTAMFYPPNWLFFVLPATAALNYNILLQFSIAGIGMFLCARHFGLRRMSSLLAALSFMFSGSITARVVHLSILSGIALYPAVVLCVDGAMRRATGRWIAGGACAVMLQAVAGHPQAPVYTAVSVGLLALFRCIQRYFSVREWRPVLAVLLRGAGAYVLGGGLAAIQLLPWFELALASPRAAGASYDFVMGSGSHGADFLLPLFPLLYGRPADDSVNALSDLGRSIHGWEHAFYVGLLPLGLALVGMTAGAWRIGKGSKDPRGFTRMWLLTLLPVSLVLSCGSHTPFARLVYAVPVLGKLREVERVLFVSSFSLSLLAGFGWDWVRGSWKGAGGGAEEGFRDRSRTFHLVAAAAILIEVPLFWIWYARQANVASVLGISPHDLAPIVHHRSWGLEPVAWALCSAVLLLVWAWGRPARWTLSLALAVVTADLASYSVRFNPTIEAEVFERRPDSLLALKDERFGYRKATFLAGSNALPIRVAQDQLAVSWGMAYGVEDINGFNSLQPRRYTDYLFGSETSDVSYGFLTDPGLLEADNPILSSLNVKYIIVPPDFRPLPEPELTKLYENETVRVYENHRAGQRVFFPRHVVPETDPAKVLDTVKSRGFDPLESTLVESTDLPSLPDLTGSWSARITTSEPNRIDVAASAPATGLLVLGEMYFPGWHATLDGAETPLYRANYLFRSVVVPPGTHTISFFYRPSSLMGGLAISTLAAAIVLALILLKPRGLAPRSFEDERSVS